MNSQRTRKETPEETFITILEETNSCNLPEDILDGIPKVNF